METALGTDRLGVLLAALDLCDLPPLPGPSRLDLVDKAERCDGDREVGKALAERSDDWRGRAAAPILATAEVTRRILMLAELRGALSAVGVRSVLARHHRLVLQYNRVPSRPS